MYAWIDACKKQSNSKLYAETIQSALNRVQTQQGNKEWLHPPAGHDVHIRGRVGRGPRRDAVHARTRRNLVKHELLFFTGVIIIMFPSRGCAATILARFYIYIWRTLRDASVYALPQQVDTNWTRILDIRLCRRKSANDFGSSKIIHTLMPITWTRRFGSALLKICQTIWEKVIGPFATSAR